MKNLLRTFLPAVLSLTIFGSSAYAQQKIATVDLSKLFDNYYKTKLVNAVIQKRAAELDKDDQDYKDKFKQATDEYQKLLAQANDPAISDSERDKRKADADAKYKQLQESRVTIDQFERQAQATLNEQRQQMRQKVLDAIRSAVVSKAKAGGYTLVVDTAALTVNATPMVLYSSGVDDLTDSVLAQLNVGASIDISTPDTTLPATPSLTSTNTP